MTKVQSMSLAAVVLAGSFTAANVAFAAPVMAPMDQAELAQLTPPVRHQVEAQMRDGQSVHGILETRLLNQISDRYPGQTIVAADFDRGDIVSRRTDGQLRVIPFNPQTLTLRQ